MSSFPRLNRAAIRAKVREITGIYATTVFSDSRLNGLINEEVYKINGLFDDLLVGSSTDTITVSGVAYRFPSWRWDNTTQFPTSVAANLYLESDTDTAPWSDGYFDDLLVYKAAYDVLKEQADDTKRAEDFLAKYTDLKEQLVKYDFVQHNRFLIDNIASGNTHRYQSLTLKKLAVFTVMLSGSPLNFEWEINNIIARIQNEATELYNGFTWTGIASATDWANWGYDNIEIFCYGVARKLLSQAGDDRAAAFDAEYQSRLENLKRSKLYTAGSIIPNNLGSLRTQVRALLQDFSKNLPDVLLNSWINEAYTTLSMERDWKWLTTTTTVTLPAGSSAFGLTFIGKRVKNVWQVKLDPTDFQPTQVEIVAPVPSVSSVEKNSARYYYELENIGGSWLMKISPFVTEDTSFTIVSTDSIAPLLVDADEPLFEAQFAPLLAYRASIRGLLFNPQNKNLIGIYQDAEQRLLDSMMVYYELDRSTEPFSIGENSLETRKYLPFFRVG